LVLVAEIVVLVIVGALPAQVPNQVVTAAIAFTSALQVSTLRSPQGVDYGTTLTTSNLRTLVAKAYRWCADHDATAGRQAARIGAVVAGFGVGAGVRALCTHFLVHMRCGLQRPCWSSRSPPSTSNGAPLPPKAAGANAATTRPHEMEQTRVSGLLPRRLSGQMTQDDDA
jgi:hypothetical protein